MSNEYTDGFLDAMFKVRDLIEEYLPEDTDSFEFEFWSLCEEMRSAE